MSSKIFDSDLLYQANAAKGLAEALPAVGLNAHNSQLQVSMENAIIALLAPFQPAQAQEPQPTSERRQDSDENPYGLEWAAGLIRQLPLNHDGRNSWLLNFGTAEDKEQVKSRFKEKAGTASTPEPEGEVCPGCGKVHTAEEFAHVAALRDLLEGIFGKGSVQVIRAPGTKD